MELKFNEVKEMNKIDLTITAMSEYICDKICRHPLDSSQEELEEVCAECKLGNFICDILKTVEVQDDD